MCSEAFNRIDTFLQMCFPGIKIILARFDSTFILCCAKRPFVDDVGDIAGRSQKSDGAFRQAARSHLPLWAVALAGSGGDMSSSGAALGKEPGPGPRWQ